MAPGGRVRMLARIVTANSRRKTFPGLNCIAISRTIRESRPRPGCRRCHTGITAQRQRTDHRKNAIETRRMDGPSQPGAYVAAERQQRETSLLRRYPPGMLDLEQGSALAPSLDCQRRDTSQNGARVICPACPGGFVIGNTGYFRKL